MESQERHFFLLWITQEGPSSLIISVSDIFKNDEESFSLLDSMVQRVGEENVMQLITNNVAPCVFVG